MGPQFPRTQNGTDSGLSNLSSPTSRHSPTHLFMFQSQDFPDHILPLLTAVSLSTVQDFGCGGCNKENKTEGLKCVFLLTQSRGEWYRASRTELSHTVIQGPTSPTPCSFSISWGVAVIHRPEVGLPSCLTKTEPRVVALSQRRWLSSCVHDFGSQLIGWDLVTWPSLAARLLEGTLSTWWPCALCKYMVFFHERGT